MNGRVRMLERWIVVLIAIHSAGVGALLLLLPEWSARFGGWGELMPAFFVRQAGVFHIVVAIGYLLDYFRFGSVAFLVVTKSIAFIFLAAAFTLGQRVWAIPLSALLDGLMAIVVAWVHVRAGVTAVRHGAA